jgi:hypothetical protein
MPIDDQSTATFPKPPPVARLGPKNIGECRLCLNFKKKKQ